MAGDRASRIGLAVFDLDGTLLRGMTVCEAIAAPLGRLERMRELEAQPDRDALAAARAEMAGWYEGRTHEELNRPLGDMAVAPGTFDAFETLRAAGVEIAIASITWGFAVAWFARRFEVARWIGTTLRLDGGIDHVWGADKGEWVAALAVERGLTAGQTAAVGDSAGDVPMLAASGLPVFAGATRPPGLPERTSHLPGADMRDVAALILAHGR